ncbi:MAG: tyrosine-type recombinase/integrase [Planctomycetes bacterium]|nr:tyrosine-type recombinase/integrase [Planctomycetota bacterium]
MPNEASDTGFQSVLAPLMNQFVQEKHACGYAYAEPTRLLHRLDDFLVQERLTTLELPRSLARKWLAKKPHESALTQQPRIILVRHFSRFLLRAGHPAYVPESGLAARKPPTFVPRLLSDDELVKLFHAIDVLEPMASSPWRHLVMPEVFRLLYACGFRVGEVLKLRVRDVDLDRGIITVRQAKFRKDRLVPPVLSLINRLRRYAEHFGNRPPDAFFFPGASGRPFALRTVYTVFRKLLMQCGIAHAGRGKGPRIHDFRHLFAVHTLRRWYQTGEDLDAKLPLLATYLGHQHLSGTQRYLHLTAELFPEITARLDAAFGEVIPRRIER